MVLFVGEGSTNTTVIYQAERRTISKQLRPLIVLFTSTENKLSFFITLPLFLPQKTVSIYSHIVVFPAIAIPAQPHYPPPSQAYRHTDIAPTMACAETDIEKIAKGWSIAMRYSKKRIQEVRKLDDEALEDVISDGHLVLETTCLFVHACVKQGQYR